MRCFRSLHLCPPVTVATGNLCVTCPAGHLTVMVTVLKENRSPEGLENSVGGGTAVSLGCISREHTVTRTSWHWELPHPLSLRVCKLPAPGTATSVLNYFRERKKKKGMWGLRHVNSSSQLRSSQSMHHAGKDEFQQHRAGSRGLAVQAGSPSRPRAGSPEPASRAAVVLSSTSHRWSCANCLHLVRTRSGLGFFLQSP